ncbi:MAG: hypothetical protein HQ521_04180 [Bacteroidetes bacterium]|nr:hypothetical protein [Bacteroidota bacterium]
MENLIHEKSRCLYCSEVLVGRSDKKFCSIEHKNAFSNRQNKEKNGVFRHVDNQLHRNHSVLMKFYELSKGEVPVTQKPLTLLGFNSLFYNGTLNSKTTGEKLFVIYDYGFVINKSLQIKIFYSNGGFHSF